MTTYYKVPPTFARRFRRPSRDTQRRLQTFERDDAWANRRSRTFVRGEQGGKERLPSLGLGIAVLHEVGTSEVTFLYSNARAALFRRFFVRFHYN